MASTLRILSFNSTGLGWDKRIYIKDLIDRNAPDILFIQETWLLNANMSVLNSIHQDYIGNGVSGTPDDELLLGRPRGGVGILWKRAISDSVKFQVIPGTDRACAIVLNDGTRETLYINVYLPVDNQTKTRIDQGFLTTLDAIDVFLQQCNLRNLILGGDFNCDFTRRNAHDVYLRNFIRINDLICTMDLPIAEQGHSYHDPANGSYSCIDHFITSSGVSDSVIYVKRCDDHDNPSNHIPLYMELQLDTKLPSITVTNDCKDSKPIAWQRVNEHDVKCYQQKQDILLSSVPVPAVAHCCDVSCSKSDHRQEIDQWFQDLIDCCVQADDLLPRIKHKKSNKPYWKSEVKPYKDDSLWWHNIWLLCGSPKNGPIYENKTISKRQYLYAVRRYKRQEEQLRKTKMAEAICDNKTRDFFKEVKKIKSKRTIAPSIDGHSQSEAVAEHFANKYEALFNSVPSDNNVMNDICEYINKNCKETSEFDRVITDNDITCALKMLKADKSDGQSGLISTHLLLCSKLFKSMLAMLITAIITHGYQPQSMLLATIISIPKDNRGNLCDSSNYRGITLCSSISKLLDIIILNRYSNLLSTSDMQFAFKKGHSTSMCSLMVKETVNYYFNNQSEVYSCCVDLTKAFDRVKHDNLFKVLIERKIPCVILRVILDMYERQQMRTAWNGCHSHTFDTINGVRQGGIISPILFCVFMDVLLKQLEDAGLGCWVGGHYFGSIGYADDLILLSPTVSGLKDMLNICEKFGDTFGVKYNSRKTVCVLFSKQRVASKPDIYLCGDKLMWVDSVKHLGHKIMYNLSETEDVRMKKCDLFNRVNSVVATLGTCPDNVLRKIFSTQCAHLYGTVIWSFSDKSVVDYITAWNRSVRRLFHLPYQTHRRFLPLILETPGVTDQIYYRFLKMCQTMNVSKNVKVKYLYNVCMLNARSIVRNNLNVIENRLGIKLEKVLSDGISLLKGAYLNEMSETDMVHFSMISELRDGNFLVNGFSHDEIKTFIDFICTF